MTSPPEAVQPLVRAPRPPAYRPSPNARWLWLIGGILSSLFLLAIALVLFITIPSDASQPWRLISLAAVPLAVVNAAITCGVAPWLRWRVHRWEVTTDAVYTLTGWLSRTWTIVPLSRIQTVDVSHGLIQRMFDLGSVVVRTASAQGTVTIPHLPAQIATVVAHDLAARADAIRDDAT